MAGFAVGHACPECGEPFDERPERPNAPVFAAGAVVCGAVALACAVATLGITAVLVAVVTFGMAYEVRQAPAAYRIRPRDRGRARLGGLLALAGLGVFIAYRVAGSAAPGLFSP